MIVIGGDTHKRSHTLVAVDAATGQTRGELTIAASGDGELEALRFGATLHHTPISSAAIYVVRAAMSPLGTVGAAAILKDPLWNDVREAQRGHGSGRALEGGGPPMASRAQAGPRGTAGCRRACKERRAGRRPGGRPASQTVEG
jgi:hypothetical protein